VKPTRGKKKRSRVRAGVAKVGAPRTKRATVETTDAEPDQGPADAAPGDDADAASEDSPSANVDDVAEALESDDDAEVPESDGDPNDDADAEAPAVVDDVEGAVADDVTDLAGDAEGADVADVAAHEDDESAGAGEDQAAFDPDAEDLADDAGDFEPGDADHAASEDLAAALQDVEDDARPGDEEGGAAGEGGGEAEAEADSPEARQARRQSILESLLFASDKPLTLKRMAELMHERQLALVHEALEALLLDYQGRGIELCEVAGGWQFRTAAVNSQWVQQLVGGRPVRLSRAQLETMAIVAYRQPITRPEIDEIRGVDSGGTLKVLLDRNLIRVLGKKEEPGRPLLYGTTKEFLTFFNLNDLRELPTLREYHELTEDSRRVVEARLGVDLDDLPGKGTIAMEADGETLATDVAADLGLGSARASQASEDQGADAGDSDEWAPGAGDEWAPGDGDEWAPGATEAARPDVSDEWAPEASEAAEPDVSEELAPEASEEWAPDATEVTVPDVDEAFAAEEVDAWVEEGEGEADVEADADAGEDAGPAAGEDDPAREAIGGMADDDSGEVPEAAIEASEQDPQRATPEDRPAEDGPAEADGPPEPGAATREEG
jgi:segregation and condensation protein B